MTRWVVSSFYPHTNIAVISNEDSGVNLARIHTRELAEEIVADHNQAEAMREALEACIAIMERNDCEDEFDWHSIQINQAKAALAGKG